MQNANYDHRIFNARQTNAYASLLFEHSGSALTPSRQAESEPRLFGRTVGNGTFAPETMNRLPTSAHETVAGGYAQYTYTLGSALTLMGGVRIDRSNLYGTFVTPRAHLKFSPRRNSSPAQCRKRLSHGVDSRRNELPDHGQQNLRLRARAPARRGLELWCECGYKLPIGEHVLDLSADYYYTHFDKQAVVDYDADPHRISIHG